MTHMKKRNISLLLLPAVYFVAVAAVAFFTSAMIRRGMVEDGSQQKFDRFVDEVHAGKLQIAADRWLEGVRTERERAEKYRRASADTAALMQDFVWLSLCGAGLQVFVVAK